MIPAPCSPFEQAQELDREEHHEQLVEAGALLRYAGGHRVVDDVEQRALCAEIED
jgi:hypothetical protein